MEMQPFNIKATEEEIYKCLLICVCVCVSLNITFSIRKEFPLMYDTDVTTDTNDKNDTLYKCE